MWRYVYICTWRPWVTLKSYSYYSSFEPNIAVTKKQTNKLESSRSKTHSRELSLNKYCKQEFVSEYQFSSNSATREREELYCKSSPLSCNEKEQHENVPTDTHGLIHETISSYLLGYWLTPKYKSFWRFHKGLANHRDEIKTFTWIKLPRFKQEMLHICTSKWHKDNNLQTRSKGLWGFHWTLQT